MTRNILIVLAFISPVFLFGQSVGIGTNSPNTLSILDMGPATKPIILPRLTTTQRNAINPQAAGMLLYNTINNSLEYSTGSSWTTISPLPAGTAGQTLRHNGTNWLANDFIWSNGSEVNINFRDTINSYRLTVRGLPDHDGIKTWGLNTGIEAAGSLNGVIGTSTSTFNDGIGVRGNTTLGFGMFGYSEWGIGVAGYSNNPNFGVGIGVSGNSANGVGVDGYGKQTGVSGRSTNGTAVSGISSTGYGVFGETSSGGIAIVGHSQGSTGILGDGGTTGIHGYSNTGQGVYGYSPTGFGGYFEGPKTYISRLGVGTTSPLAPLHVGGSAVLNSGSSYYFGIGYTGPSIASLTTGSWATGLLVDYDIVGKRSIVSAQNVVTSDARLKNIIGESDPAKDLDLLRHIKVTNYQYKDIGNWGSGLFKKLVAQQVEEVYPQAIRKQSGIIPDIYVLAEKTVVNDKDKILTVHLPKQYGIKAGDKIQLIHPLQGNLMIVVASVEGNSFSVKDWNLPADKLFVFGREANDVRAVDYEAISMLGISAIQQLANDNDKLEEEIRILNASLLLLITRLTIIENALRDGHKK